MKLLQNFKLIVLFFTLFALTNAAWSYYRESFAGRWYHEGQPTFIKKTDFNQYVICNENRDCADGFSSNNRIIQASRWGVTGVLSYDAKLITWSNGTSWQRYPSHRANIGGRWFHEGNPTHIEFYPDRGKFLLTNEEGQSNWGHLEGNRLVLPELHIVGTLSPEGDQISWSNNTVWAR